VELHLHFLVCVLGCTTTTTTTTTTTVTTLLVFGMYTVQITTEVPVILIDVLLEFSHFL
jgi:hypothetical protein